MKRKGRVTCEGITIERATEYSFSGDWALAQRGRAAAAKDEATEAAMVAAAAATAATTAACTGARTCVHAALTWIA